jgi:hypothetical protein
VTPARPVGGRVSDARTGPGIPPVTGITGVLLTGPGMREKARPVSRGMIRFALAWVAG